MIMNDLTLPQPDGVIQNTGKDIIALHLIRTVLDTGCKALLKESIMFNAFVFFIDSLFLGIQGLHRIQFGD